MDCGSLESDGMILKVNVHLDPGIVGAKKEDEIDVEVPEEATEKEVDEWLYNNIETHWEIVK